MIAIQLDEATRDELNFVRCQEIPSGVSDRLEMVRPYSLAWALIRIAAHLGYHAAIVHSRLKHFLARGTVALFSCRAGALPDFQKRP
jgi:hypothetical protein